MGNRTERNSVSQMKSKNRTRKSGKPRTTTIRKNYFRIKGINSGLILLGVGGLVQPTASDSVHNVSTLVISFNHILYGGSMSGSIILRMLAERLVTVKNVVCDGGITPYRLP